MSNDAFTFDRKMEVPVLALRGVNVFPRMFLHFDAKRNHSVQGLEVAMKGKQLIFVVAQKDASREDIDIHSEIYHTGTLARVKQVAKLPGGISRVLVEGISRAYLESVKDESSYYQGEIRLIESYNDQFTENEEDAIHRTVKDILAQMKAMNQNMAAETISSLEKMPDIGLLADSLATHFVKPMENKQQILEEADVKVRIQLVIRLLNSELEIARIQQDLHGKVKVNIDQNQKEYYLREQLKVIQSELGDKVDTGEEIEEYSKQIHALEADESVKTKLFKELNKLKKMNSASAEGSVVRNYLDVMLELPWNKQSEESKDLRKANQVLEKDHYGLSKVKERVLEHLAVRQMAGSNSTPIICLAGPPGTGKTSIAKSIATALGRKYVRISLGGVRDESEIRGHRRTYIGAMPGRLVNALRQAGASNPLILLDEIDKMSSDFRGDPSAALLEVLDSEQNHQFRDHYLEVPLDLSKVLFVATANSLRTIPRPLLDRLEIIEVSSYTENEKYHIAKEYLLPKQIEKHGLKKSHLNITEAGLHKLINDYTREAGVRQLERMIGELNRKAVKHILLEEKKNLRITDKNLEKFLGIPKYRYEKMLEDAQVGVARGLAWTEVGGDTLSIEVNIMPGKGSFQVTGRIGEVMKESASAAISYIRSKAESLGIEGDFYEKKDIHIHIPEGAVPKDGPSAGITLAIAVISALTNKAVRNDVAMTGEITLRGRVLPIGGLKEKILAAKRAGIFEILVPEDNRRNVSEIDTEIIEDVVIHFVETMDQVVAIALEK